jgi:hypothetical protein
MPVALMVQRRACLYTDVDLPFLFEKRLDANPNPPKGVRPNEKT